MVKSADIPFRQIPHHSALFLNYLDLTPNALQFYRYAPTMSSLEAAAQATINKLEFPRKEIASILRRQNESYGADSNTLANIAALERTDTVAVLTGQQVGLFGGPSYTVYKAITAINLAEELRRRGIRAAPIFWMDTEDHDLAEVMHCTVLSGPQTKAVDYREALFGETSPSTVPVGSIALPDTIQQVLESYLSYLPDSECKPEVHSRLKSAYKPGSNFAGSFAALMSELFAGSGLIFFDPRDAEAKCLSSTLFQKALSRAEAIYSALTQRKHELEASGFHAQVNVLENATVLFFSLDGQRRALERRPAGFGLKGEERFFSCAEILESAKLFPEKFSPNVLLRPLIQDHLFPTIAYTGGPAELAYFAQIEILYRMFERPMPVIWPRNSFTLIEDKVGAEMDLFAISMQDCFEGRPFVTELAVRNSGSPNIADRLGKMQDRLDQVLTELRPGLQSLEPPLVQAMETARSKITHNMQLLKSRLLNFEAAQNLTLPDAIDLILSNCYPNQNLQEREFGIHQFLACHGVSLLDAIRSAADVCNFSHRVLRL